MAKVSQIQRRGEYLDRGRLPARTGKRLGLDGGERVLAVLGDRRPHGENPPNIGPAGLLGAIGRLEGQRNLVDLIPPATGEVPFHAFLPLAACVFCHAVVISGHAHITRGRRRPLLALSLFHPGYASRTCRTWMALASWPALGAAAEHAENVPVLELGVRPFSRSCATAAA